jgi:uncharacterized protein
MEDDTGPGTSPESLLPYDQWTEEALRQVVVRALRHVAEEGLPGGHHFYITFRTDYPGVVVPNRLLAQYPQEMTIVLQHQFWDLRIAEDGSGFSVGLSFGGVPATLQVPLPAVTALADPQVRFALRFTPPEPPQAELPAPEPEPARDTLARDTKDDTEDNTEDAPAPDENAQVVSLDAFRRRQPPQK